MPAGEYYRPVPVDFMLLALMPDEGTIGGIHWKGRRASDMRHEIHDDRPETRGLLTMSNVQARLRSMQVEQLCKAYKGSGGNIWARTNKGVQLLNTRDEVMGNG